ncbi:MAG: phage head closure protein [Motiliproteus sp.]|nr:phage head closure protein [Motiliproteus sp.]
MGAGKYNRRVTLQSRTRSNDANGAVVDAWANVATVWAKPMTITGRERWANDYTAHEYSVSIAVRYRADLAEDMRALYNGRTLDISRIIDVDERRRELILLCKEHKNG